MCSLSFLTKIFTNKLSFIAILICKYTQQCSNKIIISFVTNSKLLYGCHIQKDVPILEKRIHKEDMQIIVLKKKQIFITFVLFKQHSSSYLSSANFCISTHSLCTSPMENPSTQTIPLHVQSATTKDTNSN